MNTRNPKVRDTYRAEIWLNAAQVSFLDSLYPDQELAIQIGLLVRDEMRASRRKTPPGKPDPIASQGTVVALRPAKRPAMMRPRATDGPEPSKVPVAPAGLLDPSDGHEEPSNVSVASSGHLESPNVLVKASKVPVTPKAATPPKAAAPPKSGTESSQPAPPPSPPAAAANLKERPFIGKIHTDNPISQLQEICHKYQVRLPQYTFGHCEEGFSCECQVKVLGKKLATTGSAPNKKAAKRNAAIEALKELGYS